jgi:glycine/D-amino acid oxidase-like deaminating enzyme
MKEVDYIIVGQGLAGTILAQTLLKKGKSVIIVDDENLSQASKVAAGLYNPVVFKRLVKSWKADELIPFMDQFYAESERLLNVKFYHKKQIVKLFAEENEKDFWLKKSHEEIGKYMGKTIYDNFLENIVNSPLGAAEVIHAGNLDTVKFLNAFRAYFKKSGILLEEKLDYDVLKISENELHYKDVQAKKIIFCEGYKSSESPFFKWLPFKLTKGEVITIQLKKDTIIPEEKVINKGVFILPLGQNKYKVGATYEWDDLSEIPTEKGKFELVQKLKKILKVPFEILDHQAGIRPTVSDRRPLLGLHPKHSTISIFNGLGTKGVMLAPFFADHLVNFLEENVPLDKEVNMERFVAKYFKM